MQKETRQEKAAPIEAALISSAPLTQELNRFLSQDAPDLRTGVPGLRTALADTVDSNRDLERHTVRCSAQLDVVKATFKTRLVGREMRRQFATTYMLLLMHLAAQGRAERRENEFARAELEAGDINSRDIKPS